MSPVFYSYFYECIHSHGDEELWKSKNYLAQNSGQNTNLFKFIIRKRSWTQIVRNRKLTFEVGGFEIFPIEPLQFLPHGFLLLRYFFQNFILQKKLKAKIPGVLILFIYRGVGGDFIIRFALEINADVVKTRLSSIVEVNINNSLSTY